MQKKVTWQWEKLDENTYRVKVIGGWIVHSVGGDKRTQSESMVFIPDRDHEWMPISSLEQVKAVKQDSGLML